MRARRRGLPVPAAVIRPRTSAVPVRDVDVCGWASATAEKAMVATPNATSAARDSITVLLNSHEFQRQRARLIQVQRDLLRVLRDRIEILRLVPGAILDIFERDRQILAWRNPFDLITS